jgi:HlyD family secretion protein
MQRARRTVAGGADRNISIAAVALAMPVALLASACGSGDAASPTTVKVMRGSVERTVSATGTLQAIDEENLGFAKGGRLTQLLVAVGQQVNAGQPLARIDDFEARNDLARAQARVAREQAALDKIKDSNQTDAADHDSDRAKDVLGATRDEADEIENAHDEELDQAHKQLGQDQDELKRVQASSRGDQDRCNRSLTGGSHRYDGYGDNADVTSRDRRGLLLESPLDMHAPSCERSDRGKAATASLRKRIDSDHDQIRRIQRQQQIENAKQRVAIEGARRDAGQARDAATGAASDRPHDIDAQAAEVADAMADVTEAQRAMQDTTLFAPAGGKVASINGTVGEYVGSASGTSAQAPGGRGALPNLDSGVGGKDDSNNKAQRPGGSSFLTLKDVNSFQVVAPFEEADAQQIQPNQKVNLTFDAVPGLTRAGRVASVAPTGAQINDVTNYYVTVVLNELDPRLRGGQTAEANVVTGGADNTLLVPTAAIQRGGDVGVVQVLQADGTIRRVQVQLGIIGDSTTQILAGLQEGQMVVLAG